VMTSLYGLGPVLAPRAAPPGPPAPAAGAWPLGAGVVRGGADLEQAATARRAVSARWRRETEQSKDRMESPGEGGDPMVNECGWCGGEIAAHQSV
jgi:hypothetical protein